PFAVLSRALPSQVVSRLCYIPLSPLQSSINSDLLGSHGTDGVGSDCAAHISAARGRFAGHAVHARGGQSAGGGAVGEEVEAALWRSAGTNDVCAGVLRRP